MTVPSTTNKWIYTGNGVATEFAYTKKIFAETDLVVELITIATGASETLTLTTDYTVSGVGDDGGGNVTLTGDAPENTHQLVIRRVIPITQEIEPVENDPNRAEVFEEAIDRGVMIAQQLQEQIDRSILQNPTQSSQVTLPNPVANRLLGWDAAGTKIENKVALSTDVYVATEAAKDAAETAQGLAEDARDAAIVAKDAAIVAKEAAEAVTGWEIASQVEAEAGTNNTKLMTPLRSAEAINSLAMKQDGTVNPTNLLSNGNFESWSAGASAAPDGWTLSGAGASVAREATIKKTGTYSAKVTRDAAITILSILNLHTEKGIAYWQGRTFTFSMWVNTDTASAVRLQVYDATNYYSSYHSGGGGWELLTVTFTINVAATQVNVYARNEVNGTVAYFDGAMCVEGSSAFAFSPKPAEEGVWADYSAVSTIVGWSSFTTKLIYTKKIGKTVFVSFHLAGTSNSETTTFTVPYISSNTIKHHSITAVKNNGVNQTSAGVNKLDKNSNIVIAYKNVGFSLFTASGDKSMVGQFHYESE